MSLFDFDLEKVSFEEGVEPQKKTFCVIWEDGRIALQAMEALIKNPIVKFIIGIVLSVGDKIAASVCTDEAAL